MPDNKRIKTDKSTCQISIGAFYDKQKQNLLTLWLVLWTIAGLGILSQFLYPMQDGLMIYLFVILSFWVYFEYKVLDAYRWRKYGEEVILFDGEYMSIENRIAGRGIAQQFDLSWIKNLRIVEHKEQYFWQAMNQAYWNIGQESLTFEFKGKEIYFGRDLNPIESKDVLKFLKSQLGPEIR